MNKEQLEVIKKAKYSKVANALGVHRQTIYNYLKENKNIDIIYQTAENILNGKTIIPLIEIEQLKEEVVSLKEKIKKLTNDNSKKEEEIEKLKQEITECKKYKELKEKYTDLLHRYDDLSNYILLVKAGKPIQRKCKK